MEQGDNLEEAMAAANAAMRSAASQAESMEYGQAIAMAAMSARQALYAVWMPIDGIPMLPEPFHVLIVQMAWQSVWHEAMHRRRHGQGENG